MKKKILSIMLAFAVIIGAAGCQKAESGSDSDESAGSAAPVIPVMRDITTFEAVEEMGFGINLGNTLESCGSWISGTSPSSYETAWGSPIITEDDIKGYAAAGFGVLRIPVAWSNMMAEDGTYTISPEYTARVVEVVNWAMATDMYVIINIHYDNGWMNKFPEDVDGNMTRYTTMWNQIATTFRDYGDKLVFESQNEELGWESLWNRWSGSNGEEKQASYDLVNKINQAFVDTVRATGSNNELRHLLISGYNTDVDLTCDEKFLMPNDPANRMAVSVHYYNPSTLTILDKDADWGKAKTKWGSKSDLEELQRNVDLLKTTFIDKGIPVIVGEYGCFGKNKEREVKTAYMLDVSAAMYGIKACPILWDTTNDEYNRYSAVFRDPEFIEKLVAPSKTAQPEAQEAPAA